MLTQNQCRLIEDLKTEFSKMNASDSVSVGDCLINKAAIDNKFNESNKRREELKCISDATNKMVDDLMNADRERLNKDLIPMGLIAWITASQNVMRIGILGQGSSYYDIQLRYNRKSKDEYLTDGGSWTYYTGFNSISYDDYCFASIEEVCKSDRFVRSIEGKYRNVLSKECK